jgi:hypothetical protein
MMKSLPAPLILQKGIACIVSFFICDHPGYLLDHPFKGYFCCRVAVWVVPAPSKPENLKFQTPSTKFQRNSNIQNPIFKTANSEKYHPDQLSLIFLIAIEIAIDSGIECRVLAACSNFAFGCERKNRFD